MELASLRAFAAVARFGSFSQAADHLHLTQPAVSKRISNLEEALDAKLFDRLGRQIELTEAGRALLSRVQDVEQSVKQAEQAVRELSGEVRGPLRIATSHHIGLHRLPSVLSAFQQSHPQVRLDIDFVDSEQAYEQLRIGQIELAVVTLAPGDISKLHSEPLWDDPLMVMVSPVHPLAEKKRVSLTELSEHPAVLPGLETFTGRIVHRHFDEHGVKLQLGMETNYLETLRMMASVGLGWTVLPSTMLGEDLRGLTLHKADMRRTLGLVYHEDRSLSRSASAFAELLRQNESG
ncbi:MAG: LysR family transcriptional regulator [Pseudomonadota bacterium]